MFRDCNSKYVIYKLFMQLFGLFRTHQEECHAVQRKTHEKDCLMYNSVNKALFHLLTKLNKSS